MSDNKPATEIILKLFAESMLIFLGIIYLPFVVVDKYKYLHKDVYMLYLFTTLFVLLLGVLYEIWDQPHNSRNFIIVAHIPQ